MDEEKKKQINAAIAVLRDICNKTSCVDCPFYKVNCAGDGFYSDFPGCWKDIL